MFPEITGDTYIDSGILGLQDRDDAVLTWLAGDEAPHDPDENCIWNDTRNKCIKWYHDSIWETVIDYGKNYITKNQLQANYQPKSNTLTNYSNVTVSDNGIISNDFIPISDYYLNNLWNGLDGKLELGNLAYKNSLTQNEIENDSISINKVNGNLITESPFKTGDVIPSFNQGNKLNCIKLSKISNSKYTVGSSASNSTYKGDVYKNLYKFIWSNKFIAIYNSNGVVATKGSTWDSDYSSNKRLELPTAYIPSSDKPSEKTFTTATSGTLTITKSGYYEINMCAGGGGGAGNSAGSVNHQSLCCGAAGGGFKGVIILNKDDKLTYTIGSGGTAGVGYTDWGNTSEGGAGGSTTLKIGLIDLVSCQGGGGGKTVSNKGNRGQAWVGYEPKGGSVTVNTSWFESSQIIKGRDGYGTSSSNQIYVSGPFNNDYGRGGSAQGFSDNKKSILGNGFAGYFNIKFLAPKEYGTTNSTIVDSLDKLYSSITYFMKI